MSYLTFACSLICFLSIKAQDAPTIQWQRNLGGSASDAAYSVATTFDGGYIVAGRTDSNDGDISGAHGQRDIWVIKLRADGTLEWQRCYGGSWAEEYIAVIHVTAENRYILAGTTSSFDGDIDCTDPPAPRGWVAQLDPFGEVEWQRCLGGGDLDFIEAIAEDQDGYMVCGTTTSTDGVGNGNNGSQDVFVSKLDLEGNIQWSKCFGGSATDIARSITKLSDGTFLITGQTRSNDGDLNDVNPYFVSPPTSTVGWIFKINSIGDLIWQRCIGGYGNDFTHFSQESPDGTVWVVGSTRSNDGDVEGNQGEEDAWIAELSADGELLRNRCFGGAGSDRFRSLQILPQGSMIAAGYTNSQTGDVTDPIGSTDVWLVHLSTDMEILWQGSYGGTSMDISECMALSPDGGVVLVGESTSIDGDLTNNNGMSDVWVVKLAPWDDTPVSEFDGGSHLQIYPNPAYDVLTIDLGELAGTGWELRIIDALGRTVAFEVIGQQAILRMPVGHLQTGTYCVLLYRNDDVHARRFINLH